jgi:hypothetical protein
VVVSVSVSVVGIGIGIVLGVVGSAASSCVVSCC